MNEVDKIVICGEFCWGEFTDAYKDRLTIKMDEISYKYIPEIESESNPVKEWNYKTNNPIFVHTFAQLVSYKERFEQLERTFVCDVLPLKIAFFCGRKKDVEYQAYNHQIKEFITIARKMVPGLEDLPECLSD